MNTNDPQSSKEPNKLSQNAQEKKTSSSEQSQQRSRAGGMNQKKDLLEYAKSNQEQLLAYSLLTIGLLILLFFNNLLGGFIIGIVAGYYFAKEIIYYIRNIGQITGGHDQLRYVILTAVLLGLFIAAPGIFIGAIIVAAFKNAMHGPSNASKPGNDRSKP